MPQASPPLRAVIARSPGRRSNLSPCTNRQEAHTDSIAEPPMSDPVEALILDLLKWIGPQPRPYAEVIDAWRTSCPRLPVWEEANARGFITRTRGADGGAVVRVTASGRAFLEAAVH